MLAPSIVARRRALRWHHAVEIVQSLDGLEQLRAEWFELYQRCPDATPFQAPAWLIPWARHFAPDRAGAIAVRDGGVLVALVPFFNWEESLLLAGTGPTDYCDGLFAERRESIVSAVMNALALLAVERACACIDLQQIPPGSALLKARPPSGGWLETMDEGIGCPVAPLRDEDGLGSLSAGLRKNLQYARSQLEKREVRTVHVVDSAMLESATQALQWLHAARWQQRGETGVLHEPSMRDFIRDVLPELNADGQLRLITLRQAERDIAALFALQGHHAAYFYLSGFDPAWSRLSPGTVTIAEAMTCAAAEGSREFHFLRGREAYKYRFGAEDRPTMRRILRRRH